MNDVWRAVILGIVEGLTEFIPVSSTGHMILVEPLLGISLDDPFWTGTFDIFIQIGAILAVAIYFWRRLYRLTFVTGQVAWQDHIVTKLFVAFLPAAVLGVLFSDFIEAHLKRPPVVAAALVAGGIGIILIERCVRHPRITDAASISLMTALLIGCFQCLALIPGTSRSAATIMGALLLGLSPAAAAEFSFFLAIPTMFAAGGYSLVKRLDQIDSQQFVVLGLGFSVAFVVALVVVAWFMHFIQHHRFTPFAVYRIILGGVVLAWMASVSQGQ
jgi:undecaprenyl-diphosphatase